MDRIVCAAVKVGDIIICGVRHYDDIMHTSIKNLPTCDFNQQHTQGFVDNRGVFLTRERAWEVADAAGQIIRRVGGDDHKLFSENLY